MYVPSKQGTSPGRSECPFRSAVRPLYNVRGRTFGGRPDLVRCVTLARGHFRGRPLTSAFGPLFDIRWQTFGGGASL